jgi:hypothetical protein
MNKIIAWIKRLFCRKKKEEKKVLEKIQVKKPFKKKVIRTHKKIAKGK